MLKFSLIDRVSYRKESFVNKGRIKLMVNGYFCYLGWVVIFSLQTDVDLRKLNPNL